MSHECSVFYIRLVESLAKKLNDSVNTVKNWMKSRLNLSCTYIGFFWFFFGFFLNAWKEFHRHTQFHITIPQRVIRIMHFSPTLRIYQHWFLETTRRKKKKLYLKTNKFGLLKINIDRDIGRYILVF